MLVLGACLSLSIGISTCETVWDSLWKPLMICHKLFSAYLHKLSKKVYSLSEKFDIFTIGIAYT